MKWREEMMWISLSSGDLLLCITHKIMNENTNSDHSIAQSLQNVPEWNPSVHWYKDWPRVIHAPLEQWVFISLYFFSMQFLRMEEVSDKWLQVKKIGEKKVYIKHLKKIKADLDFIWTIASICLWICLYAFP